GFPARSSSLAGRPVWGQILSNSVWPSRGDKAQFPAIHKSDVKALNIKGCGGCALNDAWADGPRTYLGLAVAGFPNLFTITGPQSPPVLANRPVAIEQHVEWIADCIAYMREQGLTTVEAVPGAQDNWVAHVNEVVNGTLLSLGNSWWMSANIPGKPRAFLPYLGPEGIGGYRKRCAEIAAKGYEGY